MTSCRSTPERQLRSLVAVFYISLGTLLAVRSEASPPPPELKVLQNNGELADGYIFITPNGKATSVGGNAVAAGPEIMDSLGRPVWFRALPSGGLASDFRVQTYQGQPVLTWSEGTGFENETPGATIDYIADSSYNIISSVQAGNGLDADQHEFELTPNNTALITIYHQISVDLSALGGPVNGTVLEGVVQEIDIVSGNVIFEWHSYPAVGIDETFAEIPTSAAQILDYFHINSIGLDLDGNLLVSSRHTSTVYKLDRKSGAILWRLGGKKSDYVLGTGLPFAYQHNARAVDASTIRIFDNESNGTPVLPYSRILWVHHDDTAKTATITQSFQHPDSVSAAAEGNAQALSNGNTFVGWGVTGRISEFGANGQLLYDATEPTGFSTYRAYRFAWTGHPSGNPTVTVYNNGDGTLSVHAIWNGATQVAHWQILGSTGGSAFTQLASADWNGFDTTVTVETASDAIQVVALDGTYVTLASSEAASGPFSPIQPAIITQPEAQTLAPGSTVIFKTAATGGNTLAYQWQLNGVSLQDGTSSGATLIGSQSSTLIIENATADNAGQYTCVVTNEGGSTTSDATTLAVQATATPGHLVNISCRSDVGMGDQLQIVGFIVSGQTPGTQPLLIQTSGPSLISAGITDVLAHPQINLFDMSKGATVIDSNTVGNINAAGAATSSAASADSVLVESLAAGPYTVTVNGSGAETGVALTSIDDTNTLTSFSPSQPHLINVSARANVGTGANILIGGFIIGGNTAKTVLIRSWGPSLSQLGVSGVLPDPQLQLFSLASASSPQLLATNRGWNNDPAIAATAGYIGAVGWNPSTADSAIVVTLPPGPYTAEVSGISGDTGVSLLEVDDIP